MKLAIIRSRNGKSYLLPFLYVCSLFFLWGFAHNILDVLNKHFQTVLGVSKAESAFVQAAIYGGYFLMALPAGYFIKKYGYRMGIISGLLLFGAGAFLFVPGSSLMSFPFFLFSLFTIGCGLTFLETAANPYVTELGEASTAASRLNLAQSFNGFGGILGPLVGGLLLFSGGKGETNIYLPYLIIGCIIVFVGFCFLKIPLPEIRKTPAKQSKANKNWWKSRLFICGVIALFFYVAAQIGISSFFINYVTETAPEVSNKVASTLLSLGLSLFLAGRLLGCWSMQKIAESRLLIFCSIGAIVAMSFVILQWKWLSISALLLCYFFESIMFPTIFTLTLKRAGGHTEQASSILIMSIVGGAIAPVLMGWLGAQSMAAGFTIPLVCFAIVGGYSLMENHQLKYDNHGNH